LILILYSLVSFGQDTIHHTIDSCAYKDYAPVPDDLPCDLGLFFKHENDTLRIFGTIGANCCGDHLAIIEKSTDTIFITTIDTGNLCTCTCAFCFEIKISASKNDTLVSINGSVYNTNDESNSSIEKLSINSSLITFPNPFTDLLNVSSPDHYILSIQIFNLSGQVIFQLSNPKSEKVTLDLSNHHAGVYIIRVIKADGELIVNKLIKK